MNATRAAKKVKVTAGGNGVVAHVGAHLLATLADELGLTAALSEAMAPTGNVALRDEAWNGPLGEGRLIIPG